LLIFSSYQLWKLPALLVEDYDQITPELLRTAYVEALYRVNEFEFERLTQSFWWRFLNNVSRRKSTKAVLDKFPIEAEDPDFMRPYYPMNPDIQYPKGTKKFPKSSC
jgi:hypothetical protein